MICIVYSLTIFLSTEVHLKTAEYGLSYNMLGSILWITLCVHKKLHFEFRIKDMPHFRRVGSLKVSMYMLTFCIPQSTAQIKVQIPLAILRQTDASQAERCAPESEETQSRSSSISLYAPPAASSPWGGSVGAAVLTWHSCLLSLRHCLNGPDVSILLLKNQWKFHSSTGIFVLGAVFIFHWHHVVISPGILFYFLKY